MRYGVEVAGTININKNQASHHPPPPPRSLHQTPVTMQEGGEEGRLLRDNAS